MVRLRSGVALGLAQVQEAGRRGLQCQVHVAPLHAHHAALLAHQPLHGFGLLHQHMVQQQHQPVLHLVDHPGRRLYRGADAFEQIGDKRKGGLMM